MELLQVVVFCVSVALSFNSIVGAPAAQPNYGYGMYRPSQNPYDIYRLMYGLNQQQDYSNPFYNPYNPYNGYSNYNQYGWEPYSGMNPLAGFDDQYNPNYRSLDTDVQSAGQSAAVESESSADSSSNSATKK